MAALQPFQGSPLQLPSAPAGTPDGPRRMIEKVGCCRPLQLSTRIREEEEEEKEKEKEEKEQKEGEGGGLGGLRRRRRRRR